MRRLALVVLGIVIGQLILYGASFAGGKILLPLDILDLPGEYIPVKSGDQVNQPHNHVLADLVLEDEPARIFRNAEFQAGRLPLWNPYQYAGVPSLSVFSPFAVLSAAVSSPRVLPWIALVTALVAGLGMYLFARRVLQLRPWPATVAAWCYPVTGFFVLWQGYSLTHPVVWFPLLLCAVHSVISDRSRWSIVGLATSTALVIASGHLDIAGQMLLLSALFAAVEFLFSFHRRWFSKEAMRAFAALVAGWLLGFMLASPELLPALDYAQTGSRVNKRGAGQEERPPIGLACMPQLVLPHIYGTSEKGSFPILPAKEGNLLESPASGFAGLVTALAIAPLAWGSRRHRPMSLFLAGIGLLGSAWCLNVPGFVQIMRLPGLNLMSHNRLVFATSFAILALAAIGLEVVSRGRVRWHRWYYAPIVVVAGLLAWCLYRTFFLPEMIAVAIPQQIKQGYRVGWIEDLAGIRLVQAWFVRMFLLGAIFCFAALAIWAWAFLKKRFPQPAVPLLGLVLLAELLSFGFGRAAQCDPQLYYPNIPALKALAQAAPGRIVGNGCLPANLAQTQKLFDVRGYDGVDPARFVDLLQLAAAPDTVRFDYAAVQYFVPQIAGFPSPDGVRLSPILDLLGVRYLVCFGLADQASRPFLQSEGCFVLVNYSALPRVFVPLRVEVEVDEKVRLAKLADPLFNPRQVAYVEEAVDIAGTAEGNANVLEATPQRITIAAKMQTPGLIVLSDRWNKGWCASIGDKIVPILCVDHALRGVIVPAGDSTIVFRYQPVSLRVGFGAAIAAVALLITHLFVQRRSETGAH